MPTQRVVQLCLEACDRAAGAIERLDEFEKSVEHRGDGIHRDPANIFIELREEVHDLLTTVREARDESEREACGLQP